MIRFVLPGIPPSKKNSRLIIHNKAGRAFSIPSNEYQKWEKEMTVHIMEQGIPRVESHGPFRLVIHFLITGKRAWDLSNKVESIQDLLTHAKVLSEDNRFVIQELVSHWQDGNVDQTIVALFPLTGEQTQLFEEP